ncbi:MAG: transcriptional repressor [Planctomycetes bacterium]|nr:transcriptional repressor [Planctomycetota bacterium]
MALRSEAADVHALRAEVRRAGLRATAARIAILQALRRATAPVSHADMEALFTGRGWDRTTFYRNLLDLARAGLARRTDLGDHTWRFEAVQPGQDGDPHAHFVCGSCGVVECLDDVRISVGKAAPRALRERHVEIQVRGTCDRCS